MKQKLKFTKMQGAGNDFVVLDGVSSPVALTPAQLRQLADRHFGVGADQILLVERARTGGVDFRYRIFNADGGEVEQCGNGARCFARFVRDEGLTQKSEILVETARGVIRPRIDVWPLQIEGVTVPIAVVSMGNPHAVQVVPDVATAPVATQGPLIEHHARFPQRVNAGYMQVDGRSRIALRVYERGAGETLACGTGACAAVVAGIRLGLLDSPVEVRTRGGDLTIAWRGADNPVTMTGPAATVFEGEIEIE